MLCSKKVLRHILGVLNSQSLDTLDRFANHARTTTLHNTYYKQRVTMKPMNPLFPLVLLLLSVVLLWQQRCRGVDPTGVICQPKA